MAKQITHIRKPNVSSSTEHITHVKGRAANGAQFEYPVSQVINEINNNVDSYYVEVAGYRISVETQKSAAGNWYIKTKPDSTSKDNLLSLPQF